MSRAGERAFDALSQYFLGRLQARTQAEFDSKARAEDDERRKALWREEQAARGEERGVVTRLNGGQAMEMDIGRYFDKESGEFKERVYGARPVSTEPKRSGSDFSRIVLADGSHANHPRDEPLPPGAKFYDAAAERPKGGGGRSPAPREPKRSWVVNEETGKREYKTDAEIAAGGYAPVPRTEGERKIAEQQAGAARAAGAWRSVGEAITALPRAAVTMLTGGGRQAPEQQPALSPEEADALNRSRAALAARPDAKNVVEQRLREAGLEHLIRML
jgi:hypothetical protein